MEFFRSHLKFLTAALCFAVFAVLLFTVLKFFFYEEFLNIKTLYSEYFGTKISLSLVLSGE